MKKRKRKTKTYRIGRICLPVRVPSGIRSAFNIDDRRRRNRFRRDTLSN